MIVQNWMKANPTTVSGDMLLSEANRIFSDQSIRAIPVVENERLRGLLTRAHCLRAAENVTRTQDKYEFDYFTNKLKVKDIMVRYPDTVRADDTMEYIMRIGQEDGKSQFPVLHDGKVVGIITATEIFHMAARIIGAFDNFSGVTLVAKFDSPDDMSKITKILDKEGAKLQSIYPAPRENEKIRRIIVRFETNNLEALVNVFGDEGFTVLEKNFNGKPEEYSDAS